MDVAIGIVVRNQSQLLALCLDSLNRQTVQPREILIVDNASTDACGPDGGTRNIIQRWVTARGQSSQVQVYHRKQNNLAEARQHILSITTCKWLMFLDADCTIEPACLATIQDHWRSLSRERPTLTAIV